MQKLNIDLLLEEQKFPIDFQLIVTTNTMK
jgi:hypothetical protein